MVKYIFLITLLLIGDYAMAAAQINTSRLMLSQLRGGDYAHPGDEEAIDLVLAKVLSIDPNMAEKKTLDVGCGFGGTAQYFKNKGFKHVEGIDIDAAAIAYAQQKYPDISFTVADASHFDKGEFSLIYLFNVAYAIKDKVALLRSLASISKSDGILVLFDYAQETESASEIKDLANKPMYPISFSRIEQSLAETGWEVIETVNMTQQYFDWYAAFNHKLEANVNSLEENFSQEDIAKVRKTFAHILHQLKNKELSGILIIAKKK
jgi:SAM-dependent methyltransferase